VPDDDDLRPAIAVWALLAAAALAADAVLIRRGHPTLTRAAATTPGRAIRAGLGLHFDAALGPLDLFNLAARALRRFP